MVKITMTRNREGKFTSFECVGHAGYAYAGEDIVCAGVSALVINAINSIETFTEDEVEVELDAESGLVRLSFVQGPSEYAELLLQSMILGLQGVQNNYGNEYISIVFKEV